MFGYFKLAAFSLLVGSWLYGALAGQLAFGWGLILFFLMGGRKFIYLVWHTAPRDMRYVPYEQQKSNT